MTLIQPVSDEGRCRGYHRALPMFDKAEAEKGHIYAVGFVLTDSIVYRSSWNEKRGECTWSFLYFRTHL